jgi:hypothetical protein
MTRYEQAVFCDTCGVEITWAPVFLNGSEFCCRECAKNRTCRCGDRMEWEDERRTYDRESPSAGVADILAPSAASRKENSCFAGLPPGKNDRESLMIVG